MSQPPSDDNRPGQPATSNSGDGFLGVNLEPVLRQSCNDRLSNVSWFRTNWQRGGALTGYATYRDDDRQHRVVVKLPIGPDERRWLRLLGTTNDGVAPRVWADGQSLGGYDMAWVVMERLEHGPLGAAWQGQEFELLAEAAARFYATAGASQPPPVQPNKDWEAVFDRSRNSVHHHNLANEQRWNKALKKARRKLKSWQQVWEGRPTDQWCHGDLHLANAMTRTPPPGGSAVLLDFAAVHPGHWVEDAVYFEHLYWRRLDRLGSHKPCKQIAQQLKKIGLPVTKNWPRLASVVRARLAMNTPATLCRGGDPLHVQAALEVLEAEVEKP